MGEWVGGFLFSERWHFSAEYAVWQRYVTSLKQMLSRESISTKEFALLVSNNKAVLEFLQSAATDAVTEEAIRRVLREVVNEGETRERALGEAISQAQQGISTMEQLTSQLNNLRRDFEAERRRSTILSHLGANAFVKRGLRRYTLGKVVSLGFYLLFLGSSGLVYYLQQSNKLFLLGLAVFFVPFARSLIRHENILETARYLLSRKKRKARLAALRVEYEQEYERNSEEVIRQTERSDGTWKT